MSDVDEEHWWIRSGVGLVSEIQPADGILSPERLEAERQEAEREQREADERLATEEHERQAEEAFWAARHGEEPPRYSVAKRLAEINAEGESADRRKRAGEHRSDCGCETCGARLIGTGIDPGASSRLPWQVQKSVDRVAANVEASKAAPASKHDVGKLKSAVNELKAKLEKMTGRSAPTNAELIQARLMQLTAEVDDEVRVGHSGEPGVYW